MPKALDIGNLHVIDYYLHLVLAEAKAARCKATVKHIKSAYRMAEDFDLTVELREGWAYEE